MSKAEEFIKNKSHIIENPTSVWISSCNAREAVEIAREEMIEHVCKFLDGYSFIPTYVINDLKQAMKDE